MTAMYISKDFKSGYKLTCILPDEGVEVDDILSKGQENYLKILRQENPSRDYKVNLSMPKFDISSKLNLTSIMYRLGIIDVFNSYKADFTPISENELLFLGKAEQTSRIKVNEDGVEAASCVEFSVLTGGLCSFNFPEVDEIDFILDKPFIFMIMTDDNIPVFVGKVMDPTGK